MLGLLRTGSNRPAYWKESNYDDLVDYLTDIKLIGATEKDVTEAAAIFEKVTKYALEVQKPSAANSAKRMLAEIERDSSTVKAVISGVDVRLDIDQNKHQHPSNKIGTRMKGGGTRFNADCDAAWHEGKTMLHMANWARALNLTEGQKQFHGQATPVDSIHYEGFCQLLNNKKYVLFHCYPSSSSPLKM